MSPLGFRLGRLPLPPFSLCKRLQLLSIIHECVGVGIDDSALLPLPLSHYAFLFPVISLLSCILTFLRAKFHPRGLLRAWRVSPPRLSRPQPHPSSVLFAPDLLMSIFAEPKMAHVFLRHRRREIDSFLAHDADERFARCLSLARILLASLSPFLRRRRGHNDLQGDHHTKRSGENNNNSNGTLARTHPLPCSSW